MSNKVELGSVAYLKLIILRKELERNYPKNSTMKIALSQAGIHTNTPTKTTLKMKRIEITKEQTVRQ